MDDLKLTNALLWRACCAQVWDQSELNKLLLEFNKVGSRRKRRKWGKGRGRWEGRRCQASSASWCCMAVERLLLEFNKVGASERRGRPHFAPISALVPQIKQLLEDYLDQAAYRLRRHKPFKERLQVRTIECA